MPFLLVKSDFVTTPYNFILKILWGYERVSHISFLLDSMICRIYRKIIAVKEKNIRNILHIISEFEL